MLKKVLFAIVALILLLLPLAIRWVYYYEGMYEPEQVTRPDLSEIKAPTTEVEPFADHPLDSTPGTVLVDVAHANRFAMAELSVLQARLSARGQQIELVELAEDLPVRLRYAKALIVISPGLDWMPDEIEEVQRFVDKGGRLLLVTDPTRYGIIFDEWEIPQVDDDVPHINDLAARFGLLFQSDYLYNTTDNEGNFRNIKLTDFGEHELTQGVSQVVFFAAHSITSEEPALISAGGETRSSASERVEDLTVAALVADGSVLALGDLTFMVEPQSSAYDNDQLVANIADFLSGARREYELADFPFYFEAQADLVYAGNPLLDSDLLEGGGALQSLFADEGKELTVREAEDGTSDTLFFGLYEKSEEVKPYLTAAEVTLWITPTAETENGSESAASEKATQPVTATSTVTPASETRPTPGPEITVTEAVTPLVKNRIEVESLGEMVVTGTLLLLLQSDGERQVLVVLADTETGLGNAVERLIIGNLEGCVLRDADAPTSRLALCPSGEVSPGNGDGGWQEPEPAPPTATPPITSTAEPGEPIDGAEESIMVVSLDHGVGRYEGMTGADDYEIILEERYRVEIWSTDLQGFPSADDLVDYDLVIWSSGDYEQPLDDDGDTLFEVMLQGIPIILSGSFIGDTESEAAQQDIQVHDASHPLADGFEAGEVIRFVATPSGEVYEMGVLDEFVEDEGTVVPFVRGPESGESGAPAVFIMADEFTEVRVVFIGFPLYLLPEEAKSRLVLNTVGWILGP